MPMQGSLKEMSLATLIQVNCQEMRSAHLLLASKGQRGEVYFSDGQVAHAIAWDRSGACLEGTDALYRLLSWDEGTFTLEKDSPSPAKSIDVPWSDLLLEGMKRMAEWQAAAPPPDPRLNSTLINQLQALEGVTGAVIASSDGIVLASSVPEGDGESEAAVAVFVGSAAQQIAGALKVGDFTQGIVTFKNRRVLVMAQPDRYVGLWLAENASPAIMSHAVAQLLGK